MRHLLALVVVLAVPALAHAGGSVTGKVTVTETDGKAAQGAEVIVYVVGPPADAPGAPAAPSKKVQIEQKGRRFVPDLVAITINDEVEFPNRDSFLHNVFSQSPGRKFDLGSYKKGESKSRAFSQAGVIDVYCNIHPEMAATILVLPNRWHTRAKADGTFTLDNIPAGNWTVFAYTRRATKPASAKVTVADKSATTVNLSVTRGAEAEHLNKYGSKYSGDGGTYR
ncbi:MAG TPA: hypothetical protein VFQ53_22675 [Kofleriaceae bacterium]|nr:hypothetical protein [Kofleriaceae bacterium]